MAPPPPQRAVLAGPGGGSRAPPTHKDDRHMHVGRLLLAVHQASSSIERLLAVARLSLTLLIDLMRRSDDVQDTPLLVLGHHYLSHRVLGDAKSPARPAAPLQPGTAASGSAAVAQDGSTLNDELRSYVQELCTFDGREGPKSFAGVQGLPMASLEVHMQPVAVAKAKRLGRDLSIKVALQAQAGSGSGGGGSGGGGSGGGGSGGGGCVCRALEWGEDYAISLPALMFLEPLSPACPLAFKGELAVSCQQSGLLLVISLGKDHSVRGTIEAAPEGAAAAAALAAGGPGGAAGGSTAAGSSSPSRRGSAGGGAGSQKPRIIGTVHGSLMGEVKVSCQGMEGSLYDSKAQGLPAPIPSVDLLHLGPMRAARCWSALHDALLYADPRVAQGGRAAAKLASTMSRYLRALTLSAADGAAPQGPASGAAAAGPASAGTSLAASRAGSLAAPSTAASTDSDLDEFDRQAEGLLSGGKLEAADDPRDVPPCYKEQHAAGRRLKHVLHYTLTCLPGGASS